MLRFLTAPGTRWEALARALVTVVCWPAVALTCVSVPIAKFVLVLVPLYLLWVLGVDLVAITRSYFGTVHYARRPGLSWIYGAGLVCIAVWAFFYFTPFGRSLIGQTQAPNISALHQRQVYADKRRVHGARRLGESSGRASAPPHH